MAAAGGAAIQWHPQAAAVIKTSNPRHSQQWETIVKKKALSLQGKPTDMRTAMYYTNATALVGLSHRGSRLGFHAAAAMRQPYRSTIAGEVCYTYKTAMIAAGGLAGGVSSSIAGGEFIDGLCNGLICAGLNHALHYVAGPLNKGLSIARVTKQWRHVLGPDAIAGAITMDANSGIALSAEGGGLYVLVGKDKGFYSYTDLGAGAGLVSVSAGVELVELYSSSATSEVSVYDFTGPRWEGNFSVTVYGINVGATAIYSNRYDASGVKTGYTIGIGSTVGVDGIPFKVGVNVNYGASSTKGIRGLPDELNRALKLKQP